jgi:hypothetical protein
VLELSGAYKKNPQRKKARASEIQPSAGPMPEWRCMEGKTDKDAFDILIASINPAVLTPDDYVVLHIMAHLLFLSWHDAATASQQTLLVNTLCGKFGMSPSDRARMQGPAKEKPKNRWSDVGSDRTEVR